MEKHSKIYIAGHRGLVGSAIKRKLEQKGYSNLVCRTSGELDLKNQQAVAEFFQAEKPAYVFLAAAKVGGIYASSTYPAEFIYDNLAIQMNVIHATYPLSAYQLLQEAGGALAPTPPHFFLFCSLKCDKILL